MSLIIKHNDDTISIYNQIAPGNGELLYALVEDNIVMFKKNYKTKYKELVICEKSIYDLLIESNSFGCYLYFKQKEKSLFKIKSTKSKKEILKRLFLSEKISEEEKEFFLKTFFKTRYLKEELKEFYITSLIYAPSKIFHKYFSKYKKYISNKEIGYIINFFESNDILTLKEYRNNPKRIELVYNEILNIGKKRNIFWKHYVNATYLGNETEVLRRKFFAFLPHNEKIKWINFLFANNNLIYYSTSLYEEVKEKFLKKEIPLLEKNINLDFIVFIVEDILPYMKSNNIKLTTAQVKKLMLFKETLSDIMKQIFLFEDIISLKELDGFIHEWVLSQKIRNLDKRNKTSNNYDRKKKKI